MFDSNTLKIKFEDLEMITKYKHECYDLFDLQGKPLLGLKNEDYPMYGGYEKELDYPKKMRYGESLTIMTEKESKEDEKRKKELRDLNQKSAFYDSQFSTSKKMIVFFIFDY